jgi:hypothetical protein
MVSRASTTIIYAGNFSFKLHSQNGRLLELLRTAWSLNASANTSLSDAVDVDVDRLIETALSASSSERLSAPADFGALATLAIDVVRQAVFDQHIGLMYCHGAALRTTEGKNVLLLGLSFAGKSTLCAALCFKHGWRMFVEDLVFFDHDGAVVVLRVPISLRQPSFNLLLDYGANVPAPLIGGWIVAPQMYTEARAETHFDLAVLMEEPADAGNKFISQSLTPPELLRKALSTSNALHFENGADKLYSYIDGANCQKFSGGTLAERCEFLCSL